MRNNTKLKKILTNNTIGISMDEDEWHVTVISAHVPGRRVQYNAGSFSKVIDKAYKGTLQAGNMASEG